jgi:hypothetical protein
MSSRYDIFRMDGDLPLWFAVVESLQEAKKLADRVGCECMVMDSATGEKITVNPTSD